MYNIQRLPGVKAASGLSRSTLYNRIMQGLWPTPISLGGRTVGWIASETNAIIAARIAGQSNDEIRDLVKRLHASRKEAI